VPLAKATGGVAILTKHFSNGDLIGVEPALVAGKGDHQIAITTIHTNAVGVGAGEQGGPRWGASGIGDIELSELDSLLCHPVQVRGLVYLVAKGPDIAVAHIIDEQDHDVGFRTGGGPCERAQQKDPGYEYSEKWTTDEIALSHFNEGDSLFWEPPKSSKPTSGIPDCSCY